MARRAAVIALTVGALTGCSTEQGRDAPATASPAGQAITPSAGAAADPTAPEQPTRLACGTPPKAIRDRVAVSVASHPGPVTGSAYVFAATTETGDWYVVATDRSYVRDDGSPGLGPNGDHSRSLALANEARRSDGTPALIPLTYDLSGKLPVSWDRVSWSGETLAAGRRAAQRAVDCLDGKP